MNVFGPYTPTPVIDSYLRGVFHSQRISYTSGKNPFVLKKNPSEIRIYLFVLKKSSTHFRMSEMSHAYLDISQFL